MKMKEFGLRVRMSLALPWIQHITLQVKTIPAIII